MKLLLIIGMMLASTLTMAEVPTLVQEECEITVTGELDGWYMCVAQMDMGFIAVGFFEEPDVCEGNIILSGDEMCFNLADMGFYCTDVLSNDEFSFDKLKSLFR